MKKVKATPLDDKPTRESVMQLLADLIPTKYSWRDDLEEHPDLLEIGQRIADREAQLKNDPKLVKLEEERETIRRRITIAMKRNAELAKKTQREFNAKGLTPEVVAKLAKLVSEVNK